MTNVVYLVAIVGLLLLVFIHELGHFTVARLVGMRPTRFYIGFPPAVVKRVRGGIEYGVGAIPLGGYVKIPGMFRPSERDVQRYFGPLLTAGEEVAPLVDDLQRSLVREDVASLGHALDRLEQAVDQMEPSAATRLARSGIAELRDGISPYAYWRQATWRRVAVIGAGPAANLLAAVVILAAVNTLGVPTRYSNSVANVVSGTPAEKGGIQSGDAIIELDKQWITSPQQASAIVQRVKGKALLVTVIRNGKTVTLAPIRPEKQSDGDYRLGFYWKVYYRHDNPARGLARAGSQTWNVSREIATSLPGLVQPKHRKEVSSVVGIVAVSGQTLRSDYRDYLRVVALISISLAILNLLPFLPLDGGHILVALVERVRRRALRRELVERFSFVGFALVGLLMYIGLTNDAHRYF